MKHKTLQWINPNQLAGIKDLHLLARTIVEGVMSGLHRSPQRGASIEFAEYRPYVQGDDPRFVDWDLYARTDRLHVKQFHEETNMDCTLLLDCSASMGYASGEVSKFHYARMLTACLAMMLHKQNDAMGLVAYHDDIKVHIPTAKRAHQLNRILVELDQLQPAGQTEPAGMLRYLGDILKPRGMIVLLSDLLHPIEEMVAHLKSLRARQNDVLVLQIVDPAEEEFPFDASVTLMDMESSLEQFVVPNMVRDEYIKNREAHFNALERECLASEIDLQTFRTDEPLDHALHAFMQHRNRLLSSATLKRNRVGAGGF